MCRLRKDTNSWVVKDGLRWELTRLFIWLNWVLVAETKAEEDSGNWSSFGGAEG